MFDGTPEGLTGPAEILVEGNRIAAVAQSVSQPPEVRVIDLSGRDPCLEHSKSGSCEIESHFATSNLSQMRSQAVTSYRD